ncbi:MAG: hypothetical protein LBI27_01105 [Clostridiales bacterium]|nr:hypothetical protein [Clostridiales bacterium]
MEAVDIKHLFIVNPVSQRIRGRVNTVISGIHEFFKGYPHMRYVIHVTRWEMDAVCVVRQHASGAKEMLRVHVMGGSGTLAEVIGSTIRLPNIQIAAYPMGGENSLLRYFGEKTHLFNSIRSQVLSETTPLDSLCCGHRYGVSHIVIGFEGVVGREGLALHERSPYVRHYTAFLLAVFKTIFSSKVYGQEYKINLDGKEVEGEFISILVANAPFYAKKMHPAVDAHPNDGVFDVYLVKRMSRLKFLLSMRAYLSGNHKKLADIVTHYTGTKISISSDKTMSLILDDKPFLAKSADIEILPYSVDLVLPGGIDISNIPRVYAEPKGGLFR